MAVGTLLCDLKMLPGEIKLCQQQYTCLVVCGCENTQSPPLSFFMRGLKIDAKHSLIALNQGRKCCLPKAEREALEVGCLAQADALVFAIELGVYRRDLLNSGRKQLSRRSIPKVADWNEQTKAKRVKSFLPIPKLPHLHFLLCLSSMMG